MADEERESVDEYEDEEDEYRPTPFDHPMFLPVLLWAFAGWFAWDIVTQAEAYLEYPNFNRGGLVVCAIAAVWFTYKGVKEMREGPKRD